MASDVSRGRPLVAALTSRHLCVCGVSGCGKTTVGRELARCLGRPFCDADDLHPRANVAKMSSGIPLTDDDRRPWLDAVVQWLNDTADDGFHAVIACSALTRRYRDRLRTASAGIAFLMLDVDEVELRHRLRTRTGHYMGEEMLDSQLDIVEPLTCDESGATIPATGSIEHTVAGALAVCVGPDHDPGVPAGR